MREREVVEAFNLFQLHFEALTLFLLILQNLVGHDERVGLVRLVFHLKEHLFPHHLPLEFQQTLLVLSIPNLFKKLAVPLLVDLVNNLAEKVVVVGSVEMHSLRKPIAH